MIDFFTYSVQKIGVYDRILTDTQDYAEKDIIKKLCKYNINGFVKKSV